MKKLLILALALCMSGQVVAKTTVVNELSGESISVTCKKYNIGNDLLQPGQQISCGNLGKFTDVSIQYPNGATAIIGPSDACAYDDRKLAVRKTNILGKLYYYVYCYEYQ